ncbi:MAG: T9SS type A sorting domain-containing protein [Bacteroidetes bacterium]|nr:T9SS type A sorting domain-containing protein [Bacteroidota bacterium]
MKSLLLFSLLFIFGTIIKINAQVNGPINICQGTTYNYVTAFSTTYAWSVAGGSATIATPSIQATDITFNDPAATYTITAVTTAPNATFTLIVTNDTPPAPTVNGSTICEGSTALPTANGLGTLSWFTAPTGGSSFFTGGMYNTPPLSVTTTYYVQDAVSGCTSLTRAPVTISVNPTPVVTISGLNNICSGQGVSLVSNLISGGPITSYLWNPGSFTSTSIIPTPGGTTTYTLTVTNSFSCSNAITHNVSVSPTPTVTVNSAAICAGQSVALNAAGATLFNWSPGTGLSSSVGANVTATPSSTITYTVTGTNGGCSGNGTSVVTVNPLPTVTASPTANVCLGSSVFITAGCGMSYTWSPGGSNSPANSVSPSISTTYTVTGVSATGCSNTATSFVTVNPLPTITSNPAAICIGENVTLTAVGAATYTWSPGGTLGSSISVSPAVTTTYTITGASAANCINTANTTVTVNPNRDITGTVSSTFGIISAEAYLLKYDALQLAFDTIQTTTLSSNTYNFSMVNFGSYLLKVVADTGSFPLVVPTYYGDEFQWDSAVVINHGCLTDFTADITMIEMPVNAGSGFISGNIIEDPGFGLRIGNQHNQIMVPGGPLKGIDVKLGRNPGGGIQARTMSDTTGYYEFTDIPADTYTIYVDIPGLPMDSSYHLTIASGAETITGLDYYADSNSVYPLFVAVGLPRFYEIENNMNVFPNPANQNVQIRFTVISESAKIELYNAQGITLYTHELKGLAKGEQEFQLNLDKMKIKNGVYFLRQTIAVAQKK